MNTCLAYTKPYGGTNLARAGHGKARVNASSTSSEEEAAERAAAKYFRSLGLDVEAREISCKSAIPGLPGWNTWQATLLDNPCTPTTPTAKSTSVGSQT